MRALAFLGRHGRVVLVAGLVAGILFPGLSQQLVPAIVPLVSTVLFLTTLRVGHGAVASLRRDAARGAALTLVLQLAAPLVALAALSGLGVAESPLARGVVLTLAASPLTGAPGLTLLAGADPAPALRQLAIGTVLLPFTALVVFALLPGAGGPAAVVAATGRLAALVLVAGGGALLVLRVAPVLGRLEAGPPLDGAVALTMGVVVIGLMAAVGPALRSGDPALPATLATVLTLSFGLQGAVAFLSLRAGRRTAAPALAISAGDRNLALFFAALPPDRAAELLLYLGLYQIPIYLTPLLLGPFYRRLAAS